MKYLKKDNSYLAVTTEKIIEQLKRKGYVEITEKEYNEHVASFYEK